MRDAVVLLGAILFLAANASAQGNPGESLPPDPPASQLMGVQSEPESSPLLALATASAARAPGTSGEAFPSSPAPRAPSPQQPTVYGVFQTFNWQLYGGYTYVRFYEVPGVTKNLNGFEIGMVYYPKGLWVGAEGQLVGAFGSQAGTTAKFALAMGGPRFRWSKPRAVELWAHGLVGGTHFIPQTPYGSQSSFAYEVGGGVDILAHHHRIAYRAGADMVGTRYFNTYQYSPLITAGIVYKF